MNPDSPGDRLRAARTAAGLTQRGLAKAAGLTPGHVAHLESGVRRLSLDEAYRLATLMGRSPAEIDPRLAAAVPPP